MPQLRQTDESDLARILGVLRRRFPVILVCFVASTGIAVLLTARAEKRYESSAGLLLRGGVEPQRAAETNLQLLTLPAVAGVAHGIEPAISKGEFEESVGASQRGETDILQVDATSGSPEKAAMIANAYGEAFVEYSQSDRSKSTGGKISLVERATPNSSPVSPQKTKNIGFGILIGIVLGLGLALLVEQFDRRLKREDDLEDTTGMPVLGAVPRRKSFDSRRLGKSSFNPAETEIFNLLRAKLRYFKAERSVDSIVVTSAGPGEGKSLVSLGIALAAAMSGEKVLLIEADLRSPGFSRVLGLSPGPGLSEFLSYGREHDLNQIVRRVPAGVLAASSGGASFDVIPAGAIPANPTELVESKRMSNLLKKARDHYDLVVIDTPPVLVVSDTIPLIVASSGVLAVTGLGVATRGSAGDLIDQLERLGMPVLGLVANFADRPARSYQGYGYGRPPELDVSRPPA